MNSALIDKIRYRLNEELVKRMLIEYFVKKGVQDFDRGIYPAMVADLVESIPRFEGKVEVVPVVEETDPLSGYTKLGWNLFCLGNRRLSLGTTEHSDRAEIGDIIKGGVPQSRLSRNEATPKEIIMFVERILGSSMAGQLRPKPSSWARSMVNSYVGRSASTTSRWGFQRQGRLG